MDHHAKAQEFNSMAKTAEKAEKRKVIGASIASMVAGIAAMLISHFSYDAGVAHTERKFCEAAADYEERQANQTEQDEASE